jgi:hypothetical protein
LRKRIKDYYALVRAFHIYAGLFISPFILIFCISVLAFNHPEFLNRINPVQSSHEIKVRLDSIPFDTTNLRTARALIRDLKIKGEIDFINKNDSQISFPVNKPGLKTLIAVNTKSDSVVIVQRKEGAVRAMNYLHIMPGQHNAAMRGNSVFMKIWKITADAVVYLLLLLLLSGVYLWYVPESERRAGMYSLVLGLLLFAGLLYLIL